MLTSFTDGVARDVKDSITQYSAGITAAERIGPTFANFHIIVARIKKALDPNNVANPTRLINMEKMEKVDF